MVQGPVDEGMQKADRNNLVGAAEKQRSPLITSSEALTAEDEDPRPPLVAMPDELLEHIATALVRANPGRDGVVSLVALRRSCRQARQVLDAKLARRVAAALGAPNEVSSLERFAVFLEVEAAIEEVGSCVRLNCADGVITQGGGANSSVPDPLEVLKRWAQIAAPHPDLLIHVDVHCAMTTPPASAEDHSRRLGLKVAEELASGGVSMERVTITPWGTLLSRHAAASERPTGEAARAGCGWAEMFVQFGADQGCDGGVGSDVELPERPEYYAYMPEPPLLFASEGSAPTCRKSAVTQNVRRLHGALSALRAGFVARLRYEWEVDPAAASGR